MRQEDFDGIMEGLGEVRAHVRGESSGVRLARPDVVAIRKKTGLSQRAFAAAYGLDKRAVQQWEQARRCPDRAAVTLYGIIERDPATVATLVSASTHAQRERETTLPEN